MKKQIDEYVELLGQAVDDDRSRGTFLSMARQALVSSTTGATWISGVTTILTYWKK